MLPSHPYPPKKSLRICANLTTHPGRGRVGTCLTVATPLILTNGINRRSSRALAYVPTKFGVGRLNNNGELLPPPPYTHGVGHFSLVLQQCTNHNVQTANQIPYISAFTRLTGAHSLERILYLR